MKLRLHSKKNICDDISEQYKDYIRLGVLHDGDKLPSCRELAIELGINPNTVERAYSQLESEGFVRTIPKKGSFVSLDTVATIDIVEEAHKQLTSLKAMGLGYKELQAVAKSIYMEDAK